MIASATVPLSDRGCSSAGEHRYVTTTLGGPRRSLTGVEAWQLGDVLWSLAFQDTTFRRRVAIIQDLTTTTRRRVAVSCRRTEYGKPRTFFCTGFDPGIWFISV